MAAYDIGEAFLRLTPSFAGVAEAIDREAAKWGVSAGRRFSDDFNAEVRRRTNNAPLGPSDDKSREQGGKSAGKFADAFKARLAAAMRSLPDIKINADSSDADRKIADLRAQMAAIGKRVGVDLDDKEALAKLAELTAALEALGSESNSPAVKVNTAAARAELDRLKADLDKLKGPEVTPDVKVGPALRHIAVLKAAINDTKHGASIDVKVFTGPALRAIGVIRTALLGLSAGAAITPFIGGAAALLAPAAGVGIGAAGAGGVIANAEKQIAKANAAQQSLAKAQAAAAAKQFTGTPKQQAAQRAAAQKSVAQAQSQAKAAFGLLTPAEQSLSKAQDALKASFQGWAQSLETTVLPVLTQAFRIAKPLLNVIEPLVVSVSSALHPALRQIGSDVRSAGFDRFIVTLDQLVRPAIRTGVTVIQNLGKAFGTLIEKAAPLAPIVEHGLTALTGHLATAAKSPGLTKFFDTLSKLGPTVVSTVSAIGGLGAHLLGALAPLSGPVLHVVGTLARSLSQLLTAIGPSLTRMFRQLAPIVQELISALLPPLTSLLKQVAGAIPSLAQGFVDVVKALLPLLPAVGSLLKFLGPMLQFLAPLAPYILAVVVATKAWTAAQEALKVILPLLIDQEALLNGVLAANPISLVVIAIAALVAAFILAWKHSETFRNIVKAALHAVAVAAQWVWDHIFKPVFHALEAAFWAVVHAAEAAFGALRTAWHAVASFFVGAWNNFTGTARRIWKDITGAISSVWHGLINGIKTAWHAVSSWLASAWQNLVGVATRIWNDITGGIKSAFGSVETFFGNVWYRVETIFANAVNFVTQDLINPLIRLLDAVLKVFGVKIPQIPRINVPAPTRPYTGPTGNDNGGGGHPNQHSGGRAYAHGGVEPGYAPGQDTRWARVSPGEGFLVPEAVRGLGGERGVNALNAHFSPRVRAAGGGQRDLGGVPHFFLGGVFSAIGDAAKAAVHAIRGVAASVAYRALRLAEKPIEVAMDKLAPKSFVSKIAHSTFNKIDNAVRDFISGNSATATFSGKAGVNGPGALAIWRNLRAVGMNAAQTAGVMGNMVAESGLNPFIIQGGGTSLNPAAAGAGGYGLVQWTPGAKLIPYLHGQKPSIITEVQALAAQLSGRGPSPESGAGAALRGASNPQSAARAFGLGYERYAGPPQADREIWAQEMFNRYAKKYDQGGFLPPGLTAVMNNTGRPEPVLTDTQWKALSENRGKAPITQNVYPAARMSEFEIASISANQLAFLMRR